MIGSDAFVVGGVRNITSSAMPADDATVVLHGGLSARARRQMAIVNKDCPVAPKG